MSTEELPPGSPAELTAIQEQIDEWVERGVVMARRIKRGAKQPDRVVYRVARPWELNSPSPSEQRHIHDWRYDLTQQGEDEGLVYCTGCGAELTRKHADYADPRVIRHVGDDLPNTDESGQRSSSVEDAEASGHD